MRSCAGAYAGDSRSVTGSSVVSIQRLVRLFGVRPLEVGLIILGAAKAARSLPGLVIRELRVCRELGDLDRPGDAIRRGP